MIPAFEDRRELLQRLIGSPDQVIAEAVEQARLRDPRRFKADFVDVLEELRLESAERARRAWRARI